MRKLLLLLGFVFSTTLSATHLNYSLMLSNGGVADGTISVRIADMNEGMHMTLLADGTAAASLDPAAYGTLGTIAPNFDAT